MKFLVHTLFFLFGLQSWVVAQNNNTNAPQSNSSYEKSTERESTLKEEAQPSESIQIESVSKKAKAVQSKDKMNDDAPVKSMEAGSSEKMTIQLSSSIATLNQQANEQRTRRTPTSDQQQQINTLVELLAKSAPESFEYNYFKYISGNYNTSYFSYLKKAENIRPTNTDVQIQMAGYYLIQQDKTNALNYLNKLVNSGRLSKEVINYGEDLVKSAPEKGILITHGFDDTYAAYYQQLNGKIREDVLIVSLDFLQSEAYRKKISDKGYTLPKSTVIDVQFLKEFCTSNVSKHIALSMTIPKEYLVGIQKNLFVVGLTFEYHSESDFNNFYKNDYLWNEVLTKKIIQDPVSEKGKQLSANYLPMLLHLRKVYAEKNEGAKLNQVETTTDKIAVQCRKYDQVQQLKKSY